MVKKQEVKIEEDSQCEGVEIEKGWWEQEDLQIAKKGEKRWDTLSHNGVMFPPDYEPHNIPILYDGQVFRMIPEVEEIATMFAILRDNDIYYQSLIFRSNFFTEFRKLLNKHQPGHPIMDLNLCNFTDIYNWSKKKREERLAMTKEEKTKLKEKQNQNMLPYKFCYWDGKKQQVANFRVEPPGLFRGRGKHPKQGLLKKRVMPEDITINIGEGEEIPTCPEGHHWQKVIHDHTVTWIATWYDNVTSNAKYVMLAANSDVKGMSDLAKFEKARKLHLIVNKIREHYRQKWYSKSGKDRQLGIAAYFIDKFALRVGNEKNEEEADTVGCCSLRCEHVIPMGDNKIKLRFLGKDSVLYDNNCILDKDDSSVYDLIEEFRKGRSLDADIFPEVTPQNLNDYLQGFMPELTAKVFRTYNASRCLEEQLALPENKLPKNSTVTEKMVLFNKCNTAVAILCNHQKAVSKNFDNQMLALLAKAQYTKDNIKLLKKLRLSAQKNYEDALNIWNEEQDKLQYEWLEAHGTEEDRTEYQHYVEKRGSKARVGGVKGQRSTSSSSTPKSKKIKNERRSKKTKKANKNNKKKIKKAKRGKK